MRDDKLLDYLKSSCHGRENRKSGRELARTLGINVIGEFLQVQWAWQNFKTA